MQKCFFAFYTPKTEFLSNDVIYFFVEKKITDFLMYHTTVGVKFLIHVSIVAPWWRHFRKIKKYSWAVELQDKIFCAIFFRFNAKLRKDIRPREVFISRKIAFLGMKEWFLRLYLIDFFVQHKNTFQMRYCTMLGDPLRILYLHCRS